MSAPSTAAARFNLGTALAHAGRVDEALRHLHEAVRLAGSNGQALYGLAEAYAAQGEYDLAVATSDRALRLELPQDLAQMVRERRAQFVRQRSLG